MAQLFHHSATPVGRIVFYGLPLLLISAGIGGAAFYRSSYATGINETVEQPVPFSHLHHVGQLGIDCRYCHTSVEDSSYAGVPPTKTCMNCHQQMWVGAELLTNVRLAYRDDKPIQWNRVHNLPQYAYFNHSIHVAKGVGCVECHGRIDEMHLVFQSKTLLMEWCLACHREPEKHLRPVAEITSMTWTPSKETIDPDSGQPFPNNQADLGKLLKEKYHVRDAITMTSCSMCHR